MWRAVVTCGAIMAALGSMHIGLPGIDFTDMEERMGGPFNKANLAIGALGVMPLLTAGFLVELLTLWRPAKSGVVASPPFGFWRGDRGGAPNDFASRGRLVYAVTLLFALFQAMGVAYFLRRMQLPGYPDSNWLIIATLVGGVFCHAALARVIDDQGLGSGVLIMFVCNALGDLPDRLRGPDSVAPAIAAFTVAAVATFFILKPGAQAVKPRLPTLTAGFLPLAFGGYVVSLLTSPWGSVPLADLAETLLNRVGGTLESAGAFALHAVLVQTALAAVAIFVGAIAISWVVVRPGALATLWAKVTAEGDEASWAKQLRPALWLGVALSAGLSLALSLVDRGAGYLQSSMMLASAGALAAAIAVDMRGAGQTTDADTVIWVDTRIAWVMPIREALSRAGIPSATLGEAASTLLPLNGPLVATRFLVASSHAAKASAIIVELLADQTDIFASAAKRAPSSEPPTLPKQAAIATFLALIAGGAMVAWPTAKAIQEQLTSPPPGEAATLAFLPVDDDSDPLARWGSGNFTPPEGIETSLENAPLGEGMGTATRVFATARARGNETHALAGTRLLEFLATVDIPPQRRWALEALPQYDDEKPGWRSHLLRTDGTSLTHDDLRAVEALPDAQDPQRWQLHLQLTARGGQAFEELTGANVRRRFAILVNDKVESAPVINQRITGGSAVITMGASSPNSKADAFALRDALRRSMGKR